MTAKPLSTLALALLLAACGSDAPRRDATSLRTLPTYTVGTEAAGASRAWDGVVEAVRQADLSAQTAGRVTAVNVDVDDAVKAGQVLLRLTAVEQQAGLNTARAQLRAAEAAAVEAEASYRRFAALAGTQYVSRAQLDQARAARDAAIAARDAARAQVAQAGQQADYTVVRAPFDGIVNRRHVEPGEAVAPGQMLLSMHAPGALRIEVQVPQSEADAIRKVARAEIVLDDGRRLAAAETVVFPAADPATHSVGVRVMLPTVADAPRPGSTAKVVFPIAGAEGAPMLTIPRAALAQRGEVSGVYVVSDGRIALRQVRLGRVLGEQVEILAGLKPGERIARDPVAAVQALAASRNAGARND